jgi:hypothetical protein
LNVCYGLVILVSNRYVAILIAAIFFVLTFLILFQQEVTFGVWFQIEDIHHETFAIASIALGIGILIGTAITEGCQKNLE